MSRSDADSWDLASSVGATATMVAAARAVASTEPDPLIDDPFAAPLVRAVGVEFFTRVVDGTVDLAAVDDGSARMLIDVMAVRTKFFDDFFLESTAAGIRQCVILASGLDSRAYRLAWPDGTTVFEIDQPEVISFKTRVMHDLGAEPTAHRQTVTVDLRHDWPAALVEAGFDPNVPTAWSAEGLLMYLPPDAQDRLFDNIATVSAPGSRLATEYHPDAGGMTTRTALSDLWRQQGLDLNLQDLWYTDQRSPVGDYLQRQGWTVSTRTRPEVFGGYGRVYPDSAAADSFRTSLSVTAIRD
jgi:methyltransferase (TIGR00027 family)